METHQNTYLIYNPRAGRLLRRGAGALQRAAETLRNQGHKLEIIPTTGPGAATDIARDLVPLRPRMVIAAGGDGTINEILNGLAKSDVPLAILPAGTANVLAVELGIGRDMVRAAENFGNTTAIRIALGCLTVTDAPNRYFLLMAGVGLDAHIVYNLHPGLKARLGKVSYWLSGFSAFHKTLPEFDVKVNGAASRCSFALASRVRNYGGDLEIAGNACLLEEHFELVLFEGAHAYRYLKYFAGVLTRRLPQLKGVRMLKTQRATFEHPADERVYVQIDGEYAGHLPAAVEIVPNALTLMVPSSFCEREKKKRREPVATR